MSEPQWGWSDIIEVVSRFVAAALVAGFGWLMKKFTTINDQLTHAHERMDAMEKQFTASDHAAATQIVILQAYHTSNTQRLDSIENTTQRIDGKLDRLIESLSEDNRRKR